MIKLFYVIIFLFILPQNAFASTPQLLDPANNHVTNDKSPKLNWNQTNDCPSSGNCYVVEVSKYNDFSELEKSTYTNNTYYSPILTEGTWFWRVKAKDSENIWSEYSEIRTVVITNQVNPSSTPNPTQSPSSTLQPSPIPQGGNNEKEKQSFNIQINKNNIDSKDIVEINIDLKALTPNTSYYLKPSFYQEGSTNYFGYSEINNSWIKNSVTATNQYKITTDSSGNWQGKLNTKVDPDDSGFKGSGDYQLKVGRYTDTGSGLTWSNNISVSITHIEVTEESKTSPTPAPITEINILGKQLETEQELINEDEYEYVEEASTGSAEIDHQIANISAENKTNDKEPQTLVKGDYQINWWFITAGFIFITIATIYVVHQRKSMYHA